MNKIFIVACVLVLTYSIAGAHSGGTDANGCHAGSQPYHCHNSKSSSSASSFDSEGLTDLAALLLVGWLIWELSNNEDQYQYISDFNNKSSKSNFQPDISFKALNNDDNYLINFGLKYNF